MKESEKRQPVPSYEEIQEKAEVDMLKIGSYLKGKTEYQVEEKRKGKKKHESSCDIQGIEQETSEPVLPLLDSFAQGALRRRIFHDQLDSV